MPKLLIKGKHLAYEEYGEGFPILFGSSYLWDASMWVPQIEAFSRKYRCIIPELWGHGQSDSIPAIPYSIEALAKDHYQLLERLNIDRCVVVGLSVGGMWGAQLALNHPDKVSALVLMDTSVAPEPPETQQRYFGMAAMVEQTGKLPVPLVEQILPLFFAPETLRSQPGVVEDFKQRLLNWPAENITSLVALNRAIFSRASLLERLGELSMPTLVMVGEEDNPRPPHEAQAMADAIPGAEYFVIPNAGHVANLEQPQMVNEVLHDFFLRNIR
ncbi:MAG: alpha/beta fold hydrolase [Symploca sp. SIO2C1]|nr:alpha/beta fold hydrolase [Symploca sp. SIO2C1]